MNKTVVLETPAKAFSGTTKRIFDLSKWFYNNVRYINTNSIFTIHVLDRPICDMY